MGNRQLPKDTPKPILIDEWQVISFISNSPKEAIDDSSSFSQYILTGSVTDNSKSDEMAGGENEKHTGTGRIIKRMMRTMSLYESGDSNGKVSLSDLEKAYSSLRSQTKRFMTIPF